MPSGRGKGACYGGVAPLRGPFPNPRITPPCLALRLCVRCPPVPTKASLSEQAGAHIYPRMRGGMKYDKVSPFVRTPARRRRDCRGLYERGSGPPLFFCFIPVCSDSISCALRAVGKGPVMGALPPFEAPFQTPESPPVPRAEALCSLPACSNKSFAFGTGGRIHPSPYAGRHEVTTRVITLRAYPGPPPEGLPEGRARPEKNRSSSAGPYGGKGKIGMTWGLGVPLHAIPCRQVRVFRKRSFCWNTRTPGGRGDVRL